MDTSLYSGLEMLFDYFIVVFWLGLGLVHIITCGLRFALFSKNEFILFETKLVDIIIYVGYPTLFPIVYDFIGITGCKESPIPVVQ